MPQLGKLPNLAASFEKLKVILDLRNLEPNSLLVSAIHKAIDRKDNQAAIHLIKQHAEDDRKDVSDAIGEDLLQRVESF